MLLRRNQKQELLPLISTFAIDIFSLMLLTKCLPARHNKCILIQLGQIIILPPRIECLAVLVPTLLKQRIEKQKSYIKHNFLQNSQLKY